MNALIRSSRTHRLIAYAFTFIILLQLIALALVFCETHWLGPVQDFWGSIEFIDKTLASGNWFSQDLWVAHNNHRLVLSRLAFLVDYRFFHGSNIFISSLDIALIIFGCLLLAQFVKKLPMVVALAGVAILTMPLVIYNLPHTFNTQWIQCAFLALASCILFAKGLGEKKRVYLAAGVATAIACSFTTFTLTAIFPALLLLLLLDKTGPARLALAIVSFIAFAFLFLFVLPNNEATGSQYSTAQLFDLLSTTSILLLIQGLAGYLLSYLSLPDFLPGDTASTIVTILSLAWFVFALYRTNRHPANVVENACLAIMFFCICLGLTTAVGRAFMGNVGLGPRFGPIVLLYWCASWVHLLAFLSRVYPSQAFLTTASTACLLWLLCLSPGNAVNMGKRLTEDFNRFTRPQMAYISGNLGENAIYENMVPEWRKSSYPDIVRTIPLLEKNAVGIFHAPIANFAKQHHSFPSMTQASCFGAVITQKSRNQDAQLRNLVIESDYKALSYQYPYLLVYNDGELGGAAFRKRVSPFQLSAWRGKSSTWFGISGTILSRTGTQLLAMDKSGNVCPVDVQDVIEQ